MSQQKQSTKYPIKIPYTGCMPPQAVELEEAVLGALMIESTAYSIVSEILKPECFYCKSNELTYSAVVDLANSQRPIDMLTVTEQLRNRGDLETVGGPFYISQLTGKVASSVHLEYHARIIAQKYMARELIRISSISQQSAFDETLDVEDVIESASKDMDGLMEQLIGKSNGKDISEVLKESGESLYRRVDMARRNVHTGINTGLADLNRLINGWQPSELVIIAARPAMGKALKMDAKILTPNGWVLNKDLKIGDCVCSIDGRKSIVQGIFPQGFLKTYTVEFSDGRKIDCCGSHLWSVKSSRFKKENRVISTMELIELIKTEKYKNRISIPLFSGDFGIKNNFIINPYLLGVLLGDGCLTKSAQWNKPDNYIVEKIKTLISSDYHVNSKTKNNYSIVKNNWIQNNSRSNEYVTELINLGLLGKRSYEKFIPDCYLNSSREQRLELLNGLLDTDGDVDKLGSVCFNSTSEKLAKDVQYLCRSLGYKCSLNKRDSYLNGEKKRDSYRLVISKEDNSELFCTPIKKDRLKKRKTKPLTIVNITNTGKYEDCQCISVSHPSSLYITDDFIVTHNTALMLHFAKKAAIAGVPVTIFSLEMSDVSLADRLILSECDVDADKYKSGYLSNEELKEIESARGRLYMLPIYIDDNPCVSMRYIRSRCKLLKKKGKCGMILVDYLQLGQEDESERNREREIAKMSRMAKITAKELEVPFILLSQLNRDCEKRGDKKPMLSDLRESGAIEQDADMVCFIHRPEYYGIAPTNRQGIEEKNYAEFIIAKNRNGRTGLVKLKHNESLTKFYDYGSLEFDNKPF